jgi:hypothetical protein
MEIYFDWKRALGGLQGPVVQQFDEPTSIRVEYPEANVILSNVEPGKAYSVYELLSKNSDGDLWTDRFTSNIQLFKRNLFWPVSNMDALPFDRNDVVSNIDFDLHHTRIRTDNMAMRLTTRPESQDLFELNGNFDCSFVMFLDSNVETYHAFDVGLTNDGVYFFTPELPDYIELYHVYVFNNSDNHENNPIQLIDMNNDVLVQSDELGVLTVALDTDLHSGLLGQNLSLQDINNYTTNVSQTMEVRDGSLRRLYKEFPAVEFGTLFTPHFNTFVYEFPNIDDSYQTYDVSMSIVVRDKRDSHDDYKYYVTSHKHIHTVQTDGTYPPPTAIEIDGFHKTSPNSVRFEFPSDYFIGLKFGLEANVSLLDMYNAYLFGNNPVGHLQFHV